MTEFPPSEIWSTLLKRWAATPRLHAGPTFPGLCGTMLARRTQHTVPVAASRQSAADFGFKNGGALARRRYRVSNCGLSISRSAVVPDQAEEDETDQHQDEKCWHSESPFARGRATRERSSRVLARARPICRARIGKTSNLNSFTNTNNFLGWRASPGLGYRMFMVFLASGFCRSVVRRERTRWRKSPLRSIRRPGP